MGKEKHLDKNRKFWECLQWTYDSNVGSCCLLKYCL